MYPLGSTWRRIIRRSRGANRNEDHEDEERHLSSEECSLALVYEREGVGSARLTSVVSVEKTAVIVIIVKTIEA